MTVPSPKSLNWDAAKVAVAAWVAAALGPVPVVWGLDAMARAAKYPTIVLHWQEDEDEGMGEEWVSDAPSAPAPALNQELIVSTVERSLLTLHVYALCDQANGSGSGGPIALLKRVRAHLRNPEVVELLAAAGLGHETTTKIQTDTEIHEPGWRPAAVMAARFNTAEAFESSTGYIAEVKARLKLDGGEPVSIQYPVVDPPPEEP